MATASLQMNVAKAAGPSAATWQAFLFFKLALGISGLSGVRGGVGWGVHKGHSKKSLHAESCTTGKGLCSILCAHPNLNTVSCLLGDIRGN